MVDQRSAKEVTFNPSIRSRSVTLEGDLFDPAGTLTGGARKQSGSLLTGLRKLNTKKNELNDHIILHRQYCEELSSLRKALVKYSEIDKQLKLKQHEAELLDQRIKQSPQHQVRVPFKLRQ